MRAQDAYLKKKGVIDENFYNQILNGDAYELIKQLPDKSIDLIVTDPPYELAKRSSTTGYFSKSINNLYEDFEDANVMGGVLNSILDEFMRVMKKPNIYIWCNKKQVAAYLNYFVVKHKCAFEIMVWIKSNPIPLCGRNYMNDKEFCLYFRKGIPLSTTYETGKTYWISQTNKVDKQKYNHPTVKPEFIIDMLIKNSSKEGDVILDCFVGSGTTAVCAKRMSRVYIGFELNKKFFDIANKRIASEN